jgi:hypothetical protein
MIEEWKEDEEEVVETTTEVSLSGTKVHDANDTRTKKVQSWWSLSLVRTTQLAVAEMQATQLKRIPALRNTRQQLLSSTHISACSRPLLFVSSVPLYRSLRRPLTFISISVSTSEPHRVASPNIALHCFDAPTAQAVTSCHLATPHDCVNMRQPPNHSDLLTARCQFTSCKPFAILRRPPCLSTASVALPPPDLHIHTNTSS